MNPRHLLLTLALGAGLAAAGCRGTEGPTATTVAPVTVPTTVIRVGPSARLFAEVVATRAARERGLSRRTSLAADSAMLFVFDRPQSLFFWMKDTTIPLTIAFLDADKRILNLADMTPRDTVTIHQSAGFALYAIEANRGWFDRNGITPGVPVEFTLPPGLVIEP